MLCSARTQSSLCPTVTVLLRLIVSLLGVNWFLALWLLGSWLSARWPTAHRRARAAWHREAPNPPAKPALPRLCRPEESLPASCRTGSLGTSLSWDWTAPQAGSHFSRQPQLLHAGPPVVSTRFCLSRRKKTSLAWGPIGHPFRE